MARLPLSLAALACMLPSSLVHAEVSLDERPSVAGEWGYRPEQDAASQVTPPSFCWRPQRDITSWELECTAVSGSPFRYVASVEDTNVHCPPKVFPPGCYQWRYRGTDHQGRPTPWSRMRSFSIKAGASEMPMPVRSELLARIPTHHPRLFVRPEQMPHLRQLAQGPLNDLFRQLVKQSDQLVANPPPTSEPPKYPPGTVRNSDAWRTIWWGNRTYTTRALNGAATLAFTRLLGGKEEYGQLAKRILMDCAQWDPKGSTGYRYNDEAGMPYAYYFARTYSFVHDLLSEDQRQQCRHVLQVRGEEMYRHLNPRHLWRPYSSHSNRAWHFLGEVGIAMHGEIEEADDWIWMAMNVFYNVYPVWSDEDGGWHEGYVYWNSYISRFTWWADVMRAAMRINAYNKPYFSQCGYFPMYLLPPGKIGGGFGDLNAKARSSGAVPLVTQLAAQSGNEYWQWYVEQMKGPKPTTGYVGFIRGALPKVTARSPDDLPTSRIFRGVGVAMLNTTIKDANQDVQVLFKSSRFGTQSHGYDANNSFLIWAFGQRLLIRSGYRDSYGTPHHKNWMWSTRSVNDITVDGESQMRHSAAARGDIIAFKTTPTIDVVVGEAGDTYRDKPNQPSRLDRLTRSILFIKPGLIVVFDQLVAKQPARFQYWLHATKKFTIADQRSIRLQVGGTKCNIAFLAPESLQLTQTNEYDPNPRPRIKLREWHLTAETPIKAKQVEFIAVYTPHRKTDSPPPTPRIERVDGGYVLTAKLADGQATLLLPRGPNSTISASGMTTHGQIKIQRCDAAGNVKQTLTVSGINE